MQVIILVLQFSQQNGTEQRHDLVLNHVHCVWLIVLRTCSIMSAFIIEFLPLWTIL